MQDLSLLNRLLAGERAAFESVIADHQQAIYAYLRARVIQPSDAEDLTQEVFLRFYLARARFDTTQLIRTWLMGIARNLLREHARKHRRQKEVAWTELCLELEELVHGASAGPYQDILGFLPACLSELGQSAREAIQLHYAKNLKLAEIGAKLHRSEGAVKLLIFRARQAVKRCLSHKVYGTG